jgi:hypothetical protein
MDLIVCAGMIAMIKAATTPPQALPEHSYVNIAVNTVAAPPNHAGKNTHVSFNEIGVNTLIAFHNVTAVTCIPG